MRRSRDTRKVLRIEKRSIRKSWLLVGEDIIPGTYCQGNDASTSMMPQPHKYLRTDRTTAGGGESNTKRHVKRTGSFPPKARMQCRLGLTLC